MHKFSVYNLMSSDICMYMWNYHHNQGNIYQLQKFPGASFFFFILAIDIILKQERTNTWYDHICKIIKRCVYPFLITSLLCGSCLYSKLQCDLSIHAHLPVRTYKQYVQHIYSQTHFHMNSHIHTPLQAHSHTYTNYLYTQTYTCSQTSTNEEHIHVNVMKCFIHQFIGP